MRLSLVLNERNVFKKKKQLDIKKNPGEFKPYLSRFV